MSASKIKELLKEFNETYDDFMFYEYESMKLKGKKKAEAEEGAEYCEYKLDSIADKIKKLNPSKYMINKYPEIEEILLDNY